jgi:hypothetical protein
MPVPNDYWSAWELRQFQAADRRQAIAVVVVRLLCLAAGFATFIAVVAWSTLGSGDDRCVNDCTSFELVFQAVLAALGFGVALLLLRFVKRSSYRPAGAALVLGLLLFAAWGLFLDAATHGWDNLKLV